MKKVLAIIGSYRKGGITEQTVDAVLRGAKKKGGETKKIFLSDKHIEFCTNCRVCTNDSEEKKYGYCSYEDDMNELLSEIESADSIILASPINFGSMTALMKKFVERLIVCVYWPWDKKFPKNRIKEKNKKAVIVTSSATPAVIGKILMRDIFKIMKEASGVLGARIVNTLYFGMVCMEKKQKLNSKQIEKAEAAGEALL